MPKASVLVMIGAFDFVGTFGYGPRGLSLLWQPNSTSAYTYALPLFAACNGLRALYAAGIACMIAAFSIFLVRRPPRHTIRAMIRADAGQKAST